MTHKKVITATVFGNLLEYYDWMLFSFFVSILSPLFFPAEDSLNALIYGFGVFALGFMARPIGALIFGTMGDKWGRKKTLSLSILFMAVPTVLMGLLPTYDQIGLLAPAALIICRIFQGFAAGGEVNGAVIFALEHTPLARRGFWGGFMTSSGGVGALLATVVAAFFTSAIFPEWGWRIPFILGGALGFVGYYIRKELPESPEFQAITPLKYLPLKEVIKKAPIPFLRATAVGSLIHVPFYIIVGYMNPILHTRGIITKSEMMLMNSGILAIVIFIIPFMGLLGDRHGHSRVMSLSCQGLILASVFSFWVFDTGSLWMIIGAQLLLLSIAEGLVGPSNGYLNQLFPPQYRYTGVAFASCLGTALCAGTTPLICATLSQIFDPVWGPAMYLAGLSVLVLGALWSGARERGVGDLAVQDTALRQAS